MTIANRAIKTAALIAALGLTAAACSSDATPATTTTSATTNATATSATGTATSATATSAAATSATGTDATSSSAAGTNATGSTDAAPGSGVTAAGISEAECAANKAAGKITYLSGFDFSASLSIIDVVVAKEKGYFDKMCLDVDLRPGFSVENYKLVAAGKAQFSSAGNYTEILNQSTDGARFVAMVDYGKAPIEALATKDPAITDLTQLKGKTIGVKGDLPPSIVAMLAKAGLKRGADYNEILLEGFDPVAQLSQAIDALPVYKSNEPRALDAAGVKYGLFDPAKLDVPGSFGIIYTSADFHAKHPTAVADFTRAALRGMQDAIADPAAAVDMSVAQIDAAGNQYFLTKQGETYRFDTEVKVSKASTPAGQNLGVIDPALFANEYTTYKAAGVWPDGAPPEYPAYDATTAASLYGPDGKVIWPAG